jgi:hypothetical protein
MGMRRVAGLICNWLLMRVDDNTGKCASGMDKFGSIVDRMYMMLEASF